MSVAPLQLEGYWYPGNLLVRARAKWDAAVDTEALEASVSIGCIEYSVEVHVHEVDERWLAVNFPCSTLAALAKRLS